MRPSMYIGSTGPTGLRHLIVEIADNCVDEAMAGFATRINVTIAEDGHITVKDNGRGIPIDIRPQTGKTALETVMTVLHAGGKFGGGAYKVSGGLHGVGASVVNALSSHLSAEIHRDGRAHHQEYQRGIATGPLRKGDQTTERGTSITFLPDTDIFGTIEYDFDDLASHFKDTAYLNKGLEIVFESHGTPTSAKATSNAPTFSTPASPTWSERRTAAAQPSTPCRSTANASWTATPSR